MITGGAGQIAYSLLPPLASGAVFGMDQPVILHLLDIPPAITALGGVVMELEDLAYPLLAGVLGTTDPDEAETPSPFDAGAKLPETSLECPSTKNTIPYCVATGRHVVTSDMCLSPCGFPARRAAG